MRVAAVDMGTNSVRLLVADVADGVLSEVHRGMAITRLGEGVDATGVLGDEPIERTLEVVRSYAEDAREHGAERLLLTATSAARDASNGAGFLRRLTSETGFETRLLTGEEEARTTFRGVLSGRAMPPASAVVIDVGGGSTEFVLGIDGRVALDVSVNAGAVRTTERWLDEDVIAPAQLATAQTELRAQFEREVPAEACTAELAIAVAGTATTLTAVELGLAEYDPARIHGAILSRSAVAALRDRLGALPLEERRRVVGLEPKRAPVITGGACVLGAAMDRLGVDAVEISDRDILHGIALLAAE